MAAGYISSTSGIGVADPYDAGLYEAQQDALNRIDKKEAQRQKEQAERAAQAKALIGDLKYESGFLPEDASAINRGYNEAVKAKSLAYQRMSNAPNSDAARMAFEQAKAKEAEYKNLWNTSKLDNEALIKMMADIKDDDDIESMKEKAALFRSTSIDKRTPQQRAELFNVKKQPTLDQSVDIVMKEQAELFKPKQVSAPYTENVDGREYLVTPKVNMTDDQAKATSRAAVADNRQGLFDKGLSQYKDAIIAGTAIEHEKEAQQLGFDIADDKERAAYYVYKNLQNKKRNEFSYDELKMTDADKKALDFEYKKKEIDYQGQKDAEDGLGFFARVANINQLNPSYLSGVRFVDPRNGQESYFVGQNVGAPIGNYTPKKKNKETGAIETVVDNNGNDLKSENKIELVTTDGKGGLKYTTTESMSDYASGIIQTPFKPASPEILTDLYLSGKGVNADKLIAAKNIALEKFKRPDGKIDPNKIYATKQSDRDVFAKLFANPSTKIDAIGGQTAVPTDVKKEVAKQKVEYKNTMQYKGATYGRNSDTEEWKKIQ